MAQPTPVFLAGKILLSNSMVLSWLNLVNTLVPLASGQLQILLTNNQNQLTTLLALPLDPTVAVGNIVVPITIVNDLKLTLAVWEHEFSGFNGNPNLYQDVTDETTSVYSQYSIAYYNGAAGKIIVY